MLIACKQKQHRTTYKEAEKRCQQEEQSLKMQQNPTQSNQKGMVHQSWLNVPNSSHKRTSGSKNSPTLFLSLSLSLSHTHTHTHTTLTRVYTNRVGAMPFLFAAKTTFSFSPTMDLSLKSRRINWVPGFFFFQTKENEQQCFIYLFIIIIIKMFLTGKQISQIS
jgi:hypothetical protein